MVFFYKTTKKGIGEPEYVSYLAPLCLLKRYPEPMAHGPEACEPSHPAVSGISLFSNPRNLESDF